MTSEISPDFEELLGAMLRNIPTRDSYRLSLWAGFFDNPLFAVIERDHGLLRDEFNILACLSAFGPMVARSVVMLTGRPKNSVSRGVERLLKRGFITREVDTVDRRRAILRVEPAGQALYERIMPLISEREDLMLGALNERDRKTLRRLLDKLMASHRTWLRDV